MSDMVQVPDGEDEKEWIAVHAVDFFNRISLIYGTLSDKCTLHSCPSMNHTNGTKRWDWRWQDNNQYKKPTRLPAPEYIYQLMNWVEKELNDPKLFPNSKLDPWPKNFNQRLKRIFTRLHRVFVHVYFSHFPRVQEIAGEAQVNYCYKHFWFFINKHDLVDHTELEPLNELSAQICRKKKDYSNEISREKFGSPSKPKSRLNNFF